MAKKKTSTASQKSTENTSSSKTTATPKKTSTKKANSAVSNSSQAESRKSTETESLKTTSPTRASTVTKKTLSAKKTKKPVPEVVPSDASVSSKTPEITLETASSNITTGAKKSDSPVEIQRSTESVSAKSTEPVASPVSAEEDPMQRFRAVREMVKKKKPLPQDTASTASTESVTFSRTDHVSVVEQSPAKPITSPTSVTSLPTGQKSPKPKRADSSGQNARDSRDSRDSRRDTKDSRDAQDAQDSRDTREGQKSQERDGLPPGMVRVKQFHPDVVPGGGYIERIVPRDQIPMGAEILSSSSSSAATPGTGEPRKKREIDRDAAAEADAFLPSGGILAAGRRLMSEGRLSIRKESQETTTSTESDQPAVSTSSASSASSAVPLSGSSGVVKHATPETSATPVTTVSSASSGSSPSVASSQTTNVSGSVVPPKGLGSTFLEGLPSRSGGVLPPSSAKQALSSAFGGALGVDAKGGAVTPSASEGKGGAKVVSVSEEKGGTRTAPSSMNTDIAVASTGQAFSTTTGSAGTKGRGGMILDGRMIEHSPTTQEQVVKILEVTVLPSSHKSLQLYELQIQTEKNRSIQAHLLLWPEGKFSIQARVNDNDPRPQVLAEEGIRGLGMEERLEELQRWSMREWWDNFTEKGQRPVAAWSGAQAVRATQQVAFLHDPAYQVFRLYQARKHTLSGKYPLLRIKDGTVSFSQVCMDGVDERERITPARMQEILGLSSIDELPSLVYSAVPFWLNRQAIPLHLPEYFSMFRDQLEYFFQFPILRFPDPLGGSGSIRLLLGLWEMSQDIEAAAQMRTDALQEKMVSFRASAGVLSDLVRRELWRKKDQPARLWGGYTPKHVLDAIRDDLYEEFRNMQGFQPKNPGDFQYHPETGEFQIVLRRRRCNHTLLLQGKQKKTPMLGVITMYGNQKREGLDPLVDYATLMNDPQWQQITAGLQWHNGWMMAPAEESRCLWAEGTHRPVAPVVRHMPPWHRGVAMGTFLLEESEPS